MRGTHAPTEADYVLGALLKLCANGAGASTLDLAYVHLKAYAARRAREVG